VKALRTVAARPDSAAPAADLRVVG
jgi:hypothetical protein